MRGCVSFRIKVQILSFIRAWVRPIKKTSCNEWHRNQCFLIVTLGSDGTLHARGGLLDRHDWNRCVHSRLCVYERRYHCCPRLGPLLVCDTGRIRGHRLCQNDFGRIPCPGTSRLHHRGALYLPKIRLPTRLRLLRHQILPPRLRLPE